MVIAKSKKVKPQMNNTILNMDWTNAPDPPNNQETGVARAVFIPHANSLPFEERHVTLEQPVKIGRNVYRATPSPTNTIFECRVLSRHHATLYYDKGHFFLVDNQSSNGTFINNNRCSISKEQEPHEVFSGDVVQFGIPVVENSANSEKNTFPPVVALLKLFHPDGKEAKLSFNPTMTTPLHLKELYQLNNFVQEAIQREASLESRLRTLRECVERTRSEAQASWELFVGEQRLLMRVHTLESMLAVGKQPDSNHVAQLVNDKRNYQEVAQESLRAAHEQRLALEESLERRNREAAALHHHNCTLRLAANNARGELQKLAERCERKMCAARLAIAAAEEREQTLRNQLPLAYSIQNGEGKMLIISSDNNKLHDANHAGSLEEAIRALPDYVKFLLPQHLLNKVGIKAISTDDKSEDLVNMKNDVMNTLNKEKTSDDGVSGSEPEKSESPDSCTDDEKQSRLNYEPSNEVESSSPVDAELRSDNNANSVHSEPENKDDDSGKGVEYVNILRVMAGLNEEIKTLRDRLNSINSENEQLRTVRDELLAAQTDARDDPISTVEPEDANTYRIRIADLQAQITRSTVAEEANVAEIQRLASSTAELQAELAFRPTRADIDDLTLVVGQLRTELIAKDQQIKQLTKPKSTVDKCVETSSSLEDLKKIDASDDSPNLDTGKISAEIDELFRLDDDDDDDTDSAATEIANESVENIANESVENIANESVENIANESVENIADTSSVTSEFVKLDDEERLQVTMQNGTLHALEEELVRAKEKWAELSAERAQLSAQLALLQNKRALKVDISHLLALVIPILVAYVYYALLPYIS